MNAAASILDDARDIFNSYLWATGGFVRAIPLPRGCFEYPKDTIQTDCLVFAYILSCIWQAMGSPEVFQKYYSLKPRAFANLAAIVNPEVKSGVHYAGFWAQKGTDLVATSPGTETTMRTLFRTLRNGFGHFNFRYINVTPREYFQKLGLPLPGTIIDPDFASNYRIFICDWDAGKKRFLEPKSDTRIIEAQFAELRYFLFLFLAYFFSERGRPPYKDILTNRSLV